ncbi:hypothetical protein ACU5EH_04775 [Aliivibrio salmonicida]|uniref:hypothetical protein n=1 Tax=Aliivibrio salmonicida TaxID=40269 RepID=UPI00406BF186
MQSSKNQLINNNLAQCSGGFLDVVFISNVMFLISLVDESVIYFGKSGNGFSL